jgi:predicted RNA polymerase sigma factor
LPRTTIVPPRMEAPVPSAQAPAASDTDWSEIAGLYDILSKHYFG